MKLGTGIRLAFLSVCIAGHAAAQQNLVKNGGFEKGESAQPAGWSGLDGLTCSWDKQGGNPGRCLRLDSSVQQSDKKQHQADPAKSRGKTKGGQYSTVGAHEGVWAFSAPVPMKPDDRYFIVEADVKGPESSGLFYPQLLIRGYQKFDAERDGGTSSWFQTPHEGGAAYSEQFGEKQRLAREGDYLMVYRAGLVCRIPAPGEWHHFRMGLRLPGNKKYRPDVLLLKAYAMWPLGDYYFDNIRMHRATKAEYDAAKARRHSIKGFEIK